MEFCLPFVFVTSDSSALWCHSHGIIPFRMQYSFHTENKGTVWSVHTLQISAGACIVKCISFETSTSCLLRLHKSSWLQVLEKIEVSVKLGQKNVQSQLTWDHPYDLSGVGTNSDLVPPVVDKTPVVENSFLNAENLFVTYICAVTW